MKPSAAALRLASLLVVLFGVTVPGSLISPTPVAASSPSDWPTFLHDTSRSAATTDPNLSVANAGQLTLNWATPTGGIIEASASVVGTTAYVGSFDGNEYAMDSATGAVLWKTFLNQTPDPTQVCYSFTTGVADSAAVENGVVYVGAGGTFYALDAATGAILWSTYMADNSLAAGYYDWASPLLINGSAYVSMASLCANPVVQGELIKIDLTSHAITGTYTFVPNGQLGGGSWGTPSYDPATNKIFVPTGNRNNTTETQAEAIVSIDATTMQSSDSWQLPFIESNGDSDFATSPILTTDAANDQLVSLANKNGTLFTWNRNNLAAGPIWQRSIATNGQCPECGDGSISSGAFVNGVLYWAGGHNVHNGHGAGGSVSAFNPGTGAVIWTRQTDQFILGAIAYVNGMIAEDEGNTFEVLDASTGALLYSYVLPAQVYGAVSFAQGQFYVSDTNGKLYAFGLGAAPATPPADPNCPSSLVCQDINGPAAGSELSSAGTLTVSAAGAGIKGAADQFRFLYQPVSGDSQSSVQLVSQNPQTGLTQQAGLMVRQTTAPGSPFYAALSYPNDVPPDVQVWQRSAFNANPVLLAKVPVTLPESIMIERQGNLFTAGLSSDGTNYTVIPGSTADVDLPTTSLGGLAVASGSASALGTASFSGLSFGSLLTTVLAPPPPAHPCPAGWTCSDLGNPSPIGDTTASGGSLTLAGSGTGFGRATDSAHYVYQTVSGNTAISAQVVTQSGASTNAREGLMVRANASPTSPMYSVYLQPGGSATIQWRVEDGVPYDTNIPLTGTTSPAYLKVTSWQDTTTNPAQTYFSTLTSPDGVTWAPILGSTVPLSFGSGNGSYLDGLVATSGAAGITTPVVFNAVSVSTLASPPPGICPSGWSCTDIGGQAIPAGNQLLANGGWTVQASGEIYSTVDTFRFIYQSFPNPSNSPNGDGTISAHVASQTGGGAWMRSGVMIRAGIDEAAPYYAAFVTPGNGLVVEWRPTQGALTSQMTVPGMTVPLWVKISRSTDTVHGVVDYSAYTSTDGVNWTFVPGSQAPLNLPGPLVAGLASDANSSLNLSVATYDTVTLAGATTPPPPSCPTSWTCADIGSVGATGDQSLSAGTWTVQGSGGDIWGTADAFHYVWQSLAADGTVSARVVSQTNTSPWAKAGVMLRATTDPGSPSFSAFVTPGNGVAVQWRTTQGGSTSQVLTSGTTPAWLEVGRAGSTYTAYTSADGTTWTAIAGSSVTLAMPGTVLAGLAMTSHLAGQVGTVVYDTATVSAGTPPPPPPPPPFAGTTYHPVVPTRLLDTRHGIGGITGAIGNHSPVTFKVTGGTVPANAIAVTGNLTVTGQGSKGFLFIGPFPTANPTSSTLNFPVADARANAVTVALGDGVTGPLGSLSITFVAPHNGPTAQVIFDVTGYFTPDATGATYHVMGPTRFLDTRNGTGGTSHPLGNHGVATFTVAGVGVVPAGAVAVTGNLTVTGQTSSGYLFIGPAANPNPTTSTLNFPLADDRANAVTVALGSGGTGGALGTLSVTFVAPRNGPTAQVIFDITGYFTADLSGDVYVPLSPARILDSRGATGGINGMLANHVARTFQVGGHGGVATTATAVTGNLTVTGQTSRGYFFLGPNAVNNPTSSTLNFPVGDDRANAATVALSGPGGGLSVTFVAPRNGPGAFVIFDVTGYFTP